VNGSSTSWFLGNDTELQVAPATPSGQWLSYMGTGVKRVGANTIITAQDGPNLNMGSTRVSFAAIGGAGTNQMHDYGPTHGAQKWEPHLRKSHAPSSIGANGLRPSALASP
jgi:hypothetical protein